MSTEEKNDIMKNISCKMCFNFLQQVERNMLVIDTRMPEDYMKDHIRCSISIRSNIIADLDDEELRKPFLRFTSRFRPCALKRYGRFLLYGDQDMNTQILEYLCGEVKGKEIFIFSEYDNFKLEYPYIVTTESSMAVGKVHPSEIVRGFLYLGARDHAISKEIITRMKITHILNPTEELGNKYEDGEDSDVSVQYFPSKKDVEENHYLCGIGDRVSDSIMKILEPSLEFMEKVRKENGRVLVHCSMGISRSPSLCIAWLMKFRKMTYQEAKRFVKAKRTIIKPNRHFEEELIEWGKLLKE